MATQITNRLAQRTRFSEGVALVCLLGLVIVAAPGCPIDPPFPTNEIYEAKADGGCPTCS